MQFSVLVSTLFVSGAVAQWGGIVGALTGALTGSYGASPYYDAPSPSPYVYDSSPYSSSPFGYNAYGGSSEYGYGGTRCGAVNGNCYDNYCNGSRDSPYCRTGTYAGCPCGFECGANNGPCRDSGCDGVSSGRGYGDGVCTGGRYLGCSCNLW